MVGKSINCMVYISVLPECCVALLGMVIDTRRFGRVGVCCIVVEVSSEYLNKCIHRALLFKNFHLEMAQYEQKSKHKILWYFIMHILY